MTLNVGRPWAVILMPGFFSPRWMLRPMRRGLSDRLIGQPASTSAPRFDRVTIWDNAVVFKPPAQSVDRLAEHLSVCDQPIAMVTHSFGDWIARQAIDRLTLSGRPMPVRAIASLAPVWRDVPAARLAARVGGRWLPEIAVMCDPRVASSAVNLDPAIRRLVVWASLEPWVRPVMPPSIDAEVRFVAGTHNSIVAQPGVWQTVATFLQNLEAG